MIPRLAATQFHRFMGSGRTQPALCTCEGDMGESSSFVVKLRGCIEHGLTGLAFELLASKLASYFQIPTPPPAIVSLDKQMADLIAPSAPRPACVRASVGQNFGSGEIRGGTIYPTDLPIPSAMLDAAARIFAFDALLQNPDRTHSNPNLFIRGDEFIIFDHELAFSFVYAVLPSAAPWRLNDQHQLAQHVFFRSLQGKPIDLQGFTTALAQLNQTKLETMRATLPPEWDNESVAVALSQLLGVAAHAEEFADEVRKRLK